jgi:hypothetical protein
MPRHRSQYPDPESPTSAREAAASHRRRRAATLTTPVSGPGLDPAPMTAAERLDEVARILALGILRLRARRRHNNPNGPNHSRAFGLDFSREGSVCGLEPAGSGERR